MSVVPIKSSAELDAESQPTELYRRRHGLDEPGAAELDDELASLTMAAAAGLAADPRVLHEPPGPNGHDGPIRFPRSRPDDEPVPVVWPEPEDRGAATLSELGEVEYVEDLVRPGRIIVWSAEEGSGKSYSVDDELAIRVAVAGGSFAGTWPVVQTGPALVLSEMHPDDDFEREATTLRSLGLERTALAGRYYRLSLMTAAGGRPALTVPEWRDWITAWLRDHRVLLLIVDTATGATQVDPWGRAIQEVFANLRVMLDAYPALSVVLLLHFRKPSGRGERRISDVLGEWGRWCDVVVLQENEAASLTRTKITVRKRVRHERRIVATKAGGLLVDPQDADTTGGPKVPLADVLAAVVAAPGLSYVELGIALGVSKDTASRYVTAAGDQLQTAPTGPRGQIRVYPTAAPPQTAADARYGGRFGGEPPSAQWDRRTAAPTYIGAVVPAAVVEDGAAPQSETGEWQPTTGEGAPS